MYKEYKEYKVNKHISDIYSRYRNCINKNLINGKDNFTCYAENNTDILSENRMQNIIIHIFSEYSEYPNRFKLNYKLSNRYSVEVDYLLNSYRLN